MMKLFEYFGWVGVGSIGLALVVWFLLVAAFRYGRLLWAAGAVGVAALALGLAYWNSARVTAIEVDPKEAEAIVAAAIESGRGASIYEQAAQEEPLYRRGGKRRRIGTEAALSDDGAQPNSSSTWTPLGPLPEEAQPEAPPRYLPRAELKTANRWDVLNLFFVRFTFWSTFPIVAFLYLRRFNAKEGNPLPLPVSGIWTETISPSEPIRSLRVATPEALAAELATIARRGETFLCFAPRPATLGQLWRLQLGRWKCGALAFDEAPPLRNSADVEFLFEAFWFNKMAFFLPDRAQDSFILSYLEYLLSSRSQRRARTRTPVHIIIPASVADHFGQWDLLVELAARTGIRICVLSEG